MNLRFRPLDWQGIRPPGRPHQFKATWGDTLVLLDGELRYLKVDEGSVTLQVDLLGGEQDIRIDGQPRANARVGWHGVVLSFESRKVGALSYPVATYVQAWSGQLPGWQANVRAIALGLQALRSVDRYGVTSTGQQYAGWAQIGTGATPMPAAPLTVDEAARYLASHSPVQTSPAELLTDPQVLGAAYRRAAARWHPDAPGGDADTFRRITEAYELLRGQA